MRQILPVCILFNLQATLLPEPIFTCHTPNSGLGKTQKEKEQYAGCRPRLTSCSDVAWLPDGSGLFGLEKLDESLWFYSFQDPLIIPIRQIAKKDGLRLRRPEKLAFSPNGDCLVVSCYGSLSVFPFKNNQMILRHHYFLQEKEGNIINDVAFSTDGSYLAYSVIDMAGAICFCKKEKGRYRQVSSVLNPLSPLKPKALLFSPDDRFVIIGYSYHLEKQTREEPISVLAVYPFDPIQGIMTVNPISQVSWNGGVESIVLSPDALAIYSADQVSDQILHHSFDPITGDLGTLEVILKNPESRLNFPRGLSFSPDGKFLAVSHLGDDKITVYQSAGQ